MSGKKILVVGNGPYLDLISEFGEATIDIVKFFTSPEKFELVLFTGGADVDPKLYGHTSCKMTYTNPFRDYIENQVFDLAFKHSVPMVGICRGVQWLTVMDGGRMIQHVTYHATFGEHQVRTYRKTNFSVNSYHHQMIMPRENAYIICVSPKLSPVYMVGKNNAWREGPTQEMESVYFPEINAFGVQWHPEMLEEKHPARQFFVEHTGYLLSGELEKMLELHNCPTHADLESVGRRVKYKKRYRIAKTIKERRRQENGKAIRDGKVQGQEI